MDECIKRQDAIDAIKSVPTGNWSSKRYVGEIEKIPPADVRPVVRGKWLHKEITDDFHVVGQCSVCKERKRIDNFCPNCGADMRGGD